MTKKSYLILLVLVVAFSSMLFACQAEADVASQNLSTQADQFQVFRRVIFYNSITNDIIFVAEGYCSLGNYDKEGELSVTCKVGNGLYVKHFLGLSDNVTYYVIQLDPAYASVHHYKVIFNPGIAIPDVDLDIGGN